MALIFEINTGKFPVDKKSVRLTTEKFAKFFKIRNKELSIAFVKDEEIKKMNKIYRGMNKPTDVLSFGTLKDADGYAEIIISFPKAEKQAKATGWKVGDEIKKLLIHALLHLIGYDHVTEKQAREMEGLEEKLF